MTANNRPVIATINARLDVLEGRVLGHVRRRISRNEKARLLGVTPRTVARHVAAGLIEPPDIVRGRWYFWQQEEPARSTTDNPTAKATRNPRLAHTSPENLTKGDPCGTALHLDPITPPRAMRNCHVV